MKRTSLLTLLLLTLTGCASTAHFPDNPALNGETTPDTRHGLADKDNGKVLLLLSFSGGGSRASALAYGILEALHETTTTRQDLTLLDEVDMISAVSGGSITAAYYGLYGKSIFEGFKTDFLEKDVSKELRRKLLTPSTLSRLSSDTFGSGDLLDEYMGERLFGDAPLSELLDSEGPYVQINATDLFKGGRFSFTKAQFALICSDAEKFPIARAVAASSAVPLIFSPITLINRANSCQYQAPAWIERGLNDKKANYRRYRAASHTNTYLDRERHPYIHLLDGGLTDNLGVRAVIDQVEIEDGLWNTLRQVNREQIKHIALIVVNAAATPPSLWEQSATTPPNSAVLDAATTAPLNNYNFETLEYLRSNLPLWMAEVKRESCGESETCSGPQAYMIELHLDEIENPTLRAELTSIPTDFSLPQGIPEKLINAGKTMLRTHPEFRRLLINSQQESEKVSTEQASTN